MGVVAITPQEVLETGIVPAYGAISPAATSTYTVVNDGNVLLHFKNSGTIAAVSIVTPNLVDGLAIADQAVSVAATTGDTICGPFPKSVYNDTNNLVSFSYTGPASGVTLAALQAGH